MSSFFVSADGINWLPKKSSLPLYTIVIAFLSNCFCFFVNVATPPLTEIVPSVVTFSFLWVFLVIWKTISPVGKPPPGAIGSTSAFNVTDTTFFFLKVAFGTRTTRVAAG